MEGGAAEEDGKDAEEEPGCPPEDDAEEEVEGNLVSRVERLALLLPCSWESSAWLPASRLCRRSS